MPVWVYILDVFKPLDIDFDVLVNLVDSNPLQLFNAYVKHVVEKDLKAIRNVKVYNIYFNPKYMELLIDYVVECELGEVSVKVIYSKDPRTTLMHYYEYEKSKRT